MKVIFNRSSCYHDEDWIDPSLSQNFLRSYAVSSFYLFFLPSPLFDSTSCVVLCFEWCELLCYAVQ